MPQDINPSTGNSPFFPKTTHPLPSKKRESNEDKRNKVDIDSQDIESEVQCHFQNNGYTFPVKPEGPRLLGQPPGRRSFRTNSSDIQKTGKPETLSSHEVTQETNSAKVRAQVKVPQEVPLRSGSCAPQRIKKLEEKILPVTVMPSTPSMKCVSLKKASTASSCASAGDGETLQSAEKGIGAVGRPKETHMNAAVSPSLEKFAHSAQRESAIVTALPSSIRQERNSIDTQPALNLIPKAKTTFGAPVPGVNQNPLAPTFKSQAAVTHLSLAQGLLPGKGLEAPLGEFVGDSELEQELQQCERVIRERRTVPQLFRDHDNTLLSDYVMQSRTMSDYLKREDLESKVEPKRRRVSGGAYPIESRQSPFRKARRNTHGQLQTPPKSPTGAVSENADKSHSSIIAHIPVPILETDEDSSEYTNRGEGTSVYKRGGKPNSLLSTTMPVHLVSFILHGSRGNFGSEQAFSGMDTGPLSPSNSLEHYNSAMDSVFCPGSPSRTALFQSFARCNSNDGKADNRNKNNSNDNYDNEENTKVAVANNSEASEHMKEDSWSKYCLHTTNHGHNSDISLNSQMVTLSPCVAAHGRMSVHSYRSTAHGDSGYCTLPTLSTRSSEFRRAVPSTAMDSPLGRGAHFSRPTKHASNVSIESTRNCANLEDNGTASAFRRDGTQNDEGINANIFSTHSASGKEQQWLQVPTLFYLILSLSKLQEAKRQLFQNPTGLSNFSTSSSMEVLHSCVNNPFPLSNSVKSDSVRLRQLPPSPQLMRHLYARISIAVLNLRFVLLNPMFTHWSNSKLRRSVADVADAWESSGPQSPEFEKASLQLLGLVSARCTGRVTHTMAYSVWRYIGSTLSVRVLMAVYVVMFILEFAALLPLLLVSGTTGVRIALTALVGVFILVTTMLALIVIDHNDASSKIAKQFKVEMVNYVRKAIDDMGDETEYLNWNKDSHPNVNRAQRAANSATESIHIEYLSEDDGEDDNDNNTDGSEKIFKLKEDEFEVSPTDHRQTTNGESDSLGILDRRDTKSEITAVTFPISSAPQNAVLEHERSAKSSLPQQCQFREGDYIEGLESGATQLKAEFYFKERVSLPEGDTCDEVTNMLSRDSLKPSAFFCTSLGAGCGLSPHCDDDKEGTGHNKGTNSPSDFQIPVAKELHCPSSDNLFDDERRNAPVMSRSSFQDEPMSEESHRDRVLSLNSGKRSPQCPPSVSPFSEFLSARKSISQRKEDSLPIAGNKEKNATFSPSCELPLQPSMLAFMQNERRISESQFPTGLGSLLPARASVTPGESTMGSGLPGFTVTAFVYSRESTADLAEGVLGPLWTRNFVVLQIVVLGTLESIFQHGSGRFKVFLFHVLDLDEEQIQLALNWGANQNCRVFFFSSSISTMPADIPYNMRLETPFTPRDVDTVLNSGIGINEEMSGVNVLRRSRQFSAPPYKLGRRLGGGAFGNVFEAEIGGNGTHCAVKRIYVRADHQNEGTESCVSAHLKDIAHEVEIMSQLSHPNIVQYFFCERDDNCVSIFMELCSGGSLSSIIARGELKAAEQVKCTLTGIISAVSYLHDKHIVHRDIKPENILYSEGFAKVVDFGTAVLKQGSLTNVRGTFAYMAPEVLVGDTYDKSCDVWSIGCIAAEALGVPLPHRALGLPALAEKYRHMSMDEVLEVECDEPVVADFLRLCLRRNPQARANVDELLEHPCFATDEASVERWMETVAARKLAQRRGIREISNARSPYTAPNTARRRDGKEQTSEGEGEGEGEGGDEDSMAGPNSPMGVNPLLESMSVVSLRSAQLGLKQTPWESPLSPAL